MSGPGGDIEGTDQGLFIRDVRVISRWSLRAEPFSGVFMGRTHARDGHLEPTLLVERRRYVGTGMREDLTLRNFAGEAAGVSVALEVGTDFADLFVVKLGEGDRRWRGVVGGGTPRPARPGCARTGSGSGCRSRRAHVARSGGSPRGMARVGGRHGSPRPPPAPHALPPREPQSSSPLQCAASPRGSGPTTKVHSDSLVVGLTIGRSEEDLASLRLADPTEPDVPVIAAGAPWFMALFGRDSLLTSSLSLALNPELAVGTLRALARLQGSIVDPLSEEERARSSMSFASPPTCRLPSARPRATRLGRRHDPLRRCLGTTGPVGADPAVIDRLLPAAGAALAWIDDDRDRDGDGYVEYHRVTDRRPRNQRWKDSADGVTSQTARSPSHRSPLGVQAYLYGAYVARAELAAERGDHEPDEHWAQRASNLRRRFNDDFWLPERGWFAVGLDAEKRIDALAPNMGHALWTGIIDADKAAPVARHLCSPEPFSGDGIRTLATSMGAYNPASCHNGSVWPHDTAICVVGLVRNGFTDFAQRVAAGLFEAAAYFAGRLPELFCGFDRAEVPGPVPYPSSCSPQAWASTAPIGVLSALLGLEPDVPKNSSVWRRFHRNGALSPSKTSGLGIGVLTWRWGPMAACAARSRRDWTSVQPPHGARRDRPCRGAGSSTPDRARRLLTGREEAHAATSRHGHAG